MSEIEIKFVSRTRAQSEFEQEVFPLLVQQGVSVSNAEKKRLQNDYFDTPEQDFERQKMGMRIRGCNGEYEQTVKTNGKVSGGLHERAEYNVPLSKAEADLTKFDPNIWPDDWDIEAMNDVLVRQFSTHFERTAYQVRYDDAHIELVFDQGAVITDKAESDLNEIELEIVSGNTARLFDLAQTLMEFLPIRLSDVSKAQQGYQLLHGTPSQIKPLPAFLALNDNETTENAFCLAVKCALDHWQYHEHVFLETGAEKMLAEVNRAIRLLLQSFSLYLPVLQCPEMLRTHKSLLDFMESWMWQDDLQSLRYLLSKKSLFAKCLSKQPALQSYLQGRKAGLLQAHDPEGVFFNSESTALKLGISQILNTQPWRKQVKGYDSPVMEHAKGWMSQGWQTVQTSMPHKKAMHASNYIAVEMMLRQTLFNGFLLGELFASTRGQFRAPWLDILTGIDELRAQVMLKETLHEAEVEEQESMLEWINEKTQNLLKVMERSRQVAMNADVYW